MNRLTRCSFAFLLLVCVRPSLVAEASDNGLSVQWDSIKTLCGQAFYYGSINEAAKQSEALIALSRQSGNDSLACLALMIKSTVVNDPLKSLQAFEEALKAADRFGDLKMIITAKSNFAINRFDVGDIKRAYLLTQEILILADSLNNDYAREQASLNLAQIYDYIGEPRKSIESLRMLLKMLKKSDYSQAMLSYRTAQAYAGIARCYGKLNSTDSTEWYIRQALQLAHEHQISDVLTRGYIELAAYHAKSPSPSALDLQKMRVALDSASSHKGLEDWHLLHEFKVMEAKYFLLSGQQRQCIQRANQLLPDAEKAADTETVRNIRELLYLAHSQLKEYEQAFVNHQAWTVLNDSIAAGELTTKLAIYEIDMRTQEKELENLDLRRKNELAIQRARLMGIGGVVAGILAALALGFAWRSYVQARNNAQLNAKLKHINARLERFVATISHDVLSNIDLMLTWGRVLMSKKQSKMNLETYYAQSLVVHTQIKDYCIGLLQESRSSVSALESYYDPNEVVQKVLRRFESPLRDAGFDIHYERLSFVQIPPVIVEQLFQNLITNALKYGDAASAPLLQIAEEEDTTKRKYWIVEDNGSGVSRENRALIFKEAPDKTSTGQGIGLSLLKSNLNEHGWDIWVEERHGGGARFVIYIK